MCGRELCERILYGLTRSGPARSLWWLLQEKNIRKEMHGERTSGEGVQSQEALSLTNKREYCVRRRLRSVKPFERQLGTITKDKQVLSHESFTVNMSAETLCPVLPQYPHWETQSWLTTNMQYSKWADERAQLITALVSNLSTSVWSVRPTCRRSTLTFSSCPLTSTSKQDLSLSLPPRPPSHTHN